MTTAQCVIAALVVYVGIGAVVAVWLSDEIRRSVALRRDEMVKLQAPVRLTVAAVVAFCVLTWPLGLYLFLRTIARRGDA